VLHSFGRARALRPRPALALMLPQTSR
jgi:hypothetical protein